MEVITITENIKVVPKYRVNEPNKNAIREKKRNNKKKTTEQYRQELAIYNPDIEVLEDYINARTKILHKCKICNYEWYTAPSNLFSHNGYCPKCNPKIKRNRTIEDYKEELSIKNPDIMVIGEFTNATTKLLHKCNVCSYEWDAKPSNILSGKGCPNCANKKRNINRKPTQDEYIEKVKLKNNLLKVVGTYIDMHTKIEHRCVFCNDIIMITPSGVLRGYGCKKCSALRTGQKLLLSPEQFEKNVHKNDNNIILLTQYVNSKTPIKCKCRLCSHEWCVKSPFQLYNSHCPKCVHKLQATSKRLSYEEFISTIPINSISILKETYLGTNNPVDCKCKICGSKWTVNQANSLRYIKIGCPKCANNINITHEEFINKYNNYINSDIELMDQYINVITPILCKCKICGQFSSKYPKHIITGHGCKKCSSIKRGENLKLTQEEFVDRIKNKNTNIKIEGTYNGYNERILCRCLICNKSWNPVASSILNSSGCPFCEMSIGEQRIKSYLDNHSIKYYYEHTFSDLRGINNGMLSYDFYLPFYNLLIEFQGVQHEKSINYFGEKKQFKIQQEHDNRKRRYAKKHEINLLEIWYYDLNEIEEILDIYFEQVNNLKSESLTTAG